MQHEVNSPPPAAVVDGPRARERGHQQDASGFHPQQQRQTPHRVFGSNMRRENKSKLNWSDFAQTIVKDLLQVFMTSRQNTV